MYLGALSSPAMLPLVMIEIRMCYILYWAGHAEMVNKGGQILSSCSLLGYCYYYLALGWAAFTKKNQFPTKDLTKWVMEYGRGAVLS